MLASDIHRRGAVVRRTPDALCRHMLAQGSHDLQMSTIARKKQGCCSKNMVMEGGMFILRVIVFNQPLNNIQPSLLAGSGQCRHCSGGGAGCANKQNIQYSIYLKEKKKNLSCESFVHFTTVGLSFPGYPQSCSALNSLLSSSTATAALNLQIHLRVPTLAHVSPHKTDRLNILRLHVYFFRFFHFFPFFSNVGS